MNSIKFYRQCPVNRQIDINFSEIPNWWQRVFEIMEEDGKIPLYQREEVLQDIFPNKIMEQIISILRVQEEGLKRFLPSAELPDTEKEISASRIRVNQNRLEQETKMGVQQYKFDPYNPYSTFFKNSKARSAIWDPKIVHSLEKVDLAKKANIVARKVAEDFVNWLREFSEASSGVISIELACHAFEQSFKSKDTTSAKTNTSDKKFMSHGKGEIKNVQHLKKLIEMERQKKANVDNVLSVDDVTKMFGIGCTFEACTSVSVSLKEVPIVHPPAESFLKIPPCKYVRKFHKLVKEDTNPSMVDYKLKQKLPVIHWKGERDPKNEEEALFKRLWHSIKELDSTLYFCKWLIGNPGKRAPRYLLENYETLRKKNSIASQSASSLLSKIRSADFISPSFE